MIALIEKDFPRLVATGYVKTSEATASYNCVAITLGDQARSWWPPVYAKISSYWPQGVSQQETVQAFVALYALHGFEVCGDSAPEAGYIKVALFTEPKEELFAHACLQLASGRWISKMGDQEDIMHELEGLEGPPHYFRVAQIMKCHEKNAPADLRAMLPQYGG